MNTTKPPAVRLTAINRRTGSSKTTTIYNATPAEVVEAVKRWDAERAQSAPMSTERPQSVTVQAKQTGVKSVPSCVVHGLTPVEVVAGFVAWLAKQ